MLLAKQTLSVGPWKFLRSAVCVCLPNDQNGPSVNTYELAENNVEPSPAFVHTVLPHAAREQKIKAGHSKRELDV